MPDWLTSALVTSQGPSRLSRVTRGKVSPEALQRLGEEGWGGEMQGNCADTAESTFEIFYQLSSKEAGARPGPECQ